MTRRLAAVMIAVLALSLVVRAQQTPLDLAKQLQGIANQLVTQLSEPPAPTPVVVPSVVGQTQAAATAALTGLVLRVTTSTAESASVPTGSVISQTPSAGASVAAG